MVELKQRHVQEEIFDFGEQEKKARNSEEAKMKCGA